MVTEKKLSKLTFFLMCVIGFVFYFLPGEWISIQKDSAAYVNNFGREGVLPGYPFFLSVFRKVLGENFYLNGVVAAQSMLAIICTLIFVMVLQHQFSLFDWECILLYIVCMLPFSIYLPEYGITHQIMTEGITYAIFYVYFLMILKGIWTLRYRWYFGGILIAFLLGLIRSQMIFLQAICLLQCMWITYRRVSQKTVKKIIYTLTSMIVGIVIAGVSYQAIYGVAAFGMQYQTEEVEPQEANTETDKQSDAPQREAASQFDSLLLSRGFFESDPEDIDLFEDEMMKDIFSKAYIRVDEGQHRYAYTNPGLYMWENLVYDKMTIDVQLAIRDYDRENPGIRTQSFAQIYRELGAKLLLAHFDRYIYHAIRLMMPSFIATVFFQIRPIYLLCHFITLFIYVFAILLCIFSAKHNGDKEKIEFLIAILLFLIIMVVSINLAFIGLQRYMVYGMGIFYCALYLLVKDTILIPIYNKLIRNRNK